MNARTLQLLVLINVFNSQRKGITLNAPRLSRRLQLPVQTCERALDGLRGANLIDSRGRLTLAGLAVAAAVRKAARPMCRTPEAVEAMVHSSCGADRERLAA
jgi:hypothetical protein